jgi:hypothetical protein
VIRARGDSWVQIRGANGNMQDLGAAAMQAAGKGLARGLLVAQVARIGQRCRRARLEGIGTGIS